jgi:hypothetical protein
MPPKSLGQSIVYPFRCWVLCWVQCTVYTGVVATGYSLPALVVGAGHLSYGTVDKVVMEAIWIHRDGLYALSHLFLTCAVDRPISSSHVSDMYIGSSLLELLMNLNANVSSSI